MACYTLKPSISGYEWRHIPDVVYAQYGEISRTLQLIVPAEPREKLPLIVYLPGSAFYRQDMRSGLPNWAKLAHRGFAVAVLQYRESQIAKFPAQVEDVHNALTFLKVHAGEYSIDFDRVVLMGHSSGGYNALMAGVTERAYPIRAVAAFSAPSYLNYVVEVPDRGRTDYDPEDFRPELDMLGLARFEEDPELLQRALVEGYIHGPIPPILLIHGNRDRDVHVDNSRKLYARLEEAGKQAEYYELDGLDHGGTWLWDDGILDIVENFLTPLIKKEADL